MISSLLLFFKIFFFISYFFSPVGIWKEWFVEPLLDSGFYSNITKGVDSDWEKEHGMNVSDSVKEYLLTYVGKPLHQLIR